MLASITFDAPPNNQLIFLLLRLSSVVHRLPFPLIYFRFNGYSNNLAANVPESTMTIMKNTILSFALLLFGLSLAAQSGQPTAQSLTDKMAEKYQLTDQQKTEMLTIQERLLRNLSEIEGLKKTDPTQHIEKMRALKMGTDSSIERLLTKEQLTIFRQEKAEFRKQKSTLYSDLKAKGASQMQIDYKISELEEASLTGH